MKSGKGKFGTQSGKSGSPPKTRSQRSVKSPANKVGIIKSSLDNQKTQKELERLEQRRQYIKDCCTTLVVVYQDRTEKEFVADGKPRSYMELQREIARFTSKENSIYMCQDEKGNMITPHAFVPSSKFVIREIQTRTMIPPVPPAVDIRWDFKGYHGRPVQWVDSAENKRKKEAQAKLRAREEEAINHAAGNYGFSGASSSVAASDEAWEKAVRNAEDKLF